MATMKNYLSTNSKMKKSGIFTWGIPAYRSATGKLTCPAAATCLKGCYARQGFYVMPSVAKAQEARLALALTDAFVPAISAEIKRRKIARLRIHDSGDFFSRAYLNSWLAIAWANPGTRFYAYTKMIPLVSPLIATFPNNFHVIFSEGGKYDVQIDRQKDRHSRVFATVDALKAAGYSDAHLTDDAALNGEQKIGLVYHGHASKAWATSSI